MEHQERRKESRIKKQSDFRYKIVPADASDSPVIDGRLVDYSAAGIRFTTELRLEKNARLLIQLDPDNLSTDATDWRQLWETGDGDYLHVIGTVMWCLASAQESGRFEVGARFLRKALDRFTA